jgi:hypothetical protein
VRAFHYLAAIATMACASSLGSPATAAEIARTHLLTVAACPPRPVIGDAPREACARLLPRLTSALRQRLGVPPEQTELLLNEEATGGHLLDRLKDFADRLGAEDRLVILMISHGGVDHPKDGPREVFMLWTEQVPPFFEMGVATGVYLPATELAAAVHRIKAGQIVLILDACFSGLASPDFVAKHPDKDPARPEAVVASTMPLQMSKMDMDMAPLFSNRLMAALSRSHATLAEAVADASASTVRDAPEIYRSLNERFLHRDPSDAESAQQPAINDPDNLLTSIALRPVQRVGKN